jgi:hypothetical protein
MKVLLAVIVGKDKSKFPSLFRVFPKQLEEVLLYFLVLFCLSKKGPKKDIGNRCTALFPETP